MGQDRPVSSLFTLLGAGNDVFCLPTAVGFQRVLSMHVLGMGHEDPATECARHALVFDDSRVRLRVFLYVPSFPARVEKRPG
jgi:hypothetical protein